MTIRYDKNLESALKEIGFDSDKFMVYEITDNLDPERVVSEILQLDLSQGIHLDFILHDKDEPYSRIEGSGEDCLFNSRHWGPNSKANVFLRCLREWYGDTFERDSGLICGANIRRYTQQRMIELHYDETWLNIEDYSDYGRPSRINIWATEKGFIFSIAQRGKGFNAKEIDDKRITNNGGACFRGYRDTNGEIFFDNPTDTHTVFFMYKT